MRFVYLWFVLFYLALFVHGKPVHTSSSADNEVVMKMKPMVPIVFAPTKQPRSNKKKLNLSATSKGIPSPGSKVNTGKLSTEENVLLQKKCGHYTAAQKKSIGSLQSWRDEAPWVVSMAFEITDTDAAGKNDTYTTNYCSATLISDRHVLTAWHCLASLREEVMYRPVEYDEDIDKEKMRIIDGVPYVPTDIIQEGESTFDNFRFVFDDDCAAEATKAGCSVDESIMRKAVKAISPKLAANHLKHGHMDLVVFELDEPVEFSRELYPACLSETRPKNEDILHLYAYGTDRRDTESKEGSLQHISVTKLPCYRSIGLDSICLSSNAQRTAEGDSGGGFVYNKNGRTYVTGVVSGAIEITENYKEHHDTAIAHHLHWICSHIGICVDETKTEQISTFINTMTPSK